MGAVPDGSSVRKVSAGRLFFIIALFAIVCAAAVIAIDNSDDSDAYVEVDGIAYEITDNFASVVKKTSTPYAGQITIPENVTDPGSGNTYPVKSIKANAFSGCYITSVTIGSKVVTIGDGAFSPCTDLTSIDIPDNVLYFGDGVFLGCTGLESITIGRGLEDIGSGSFIGCVKLTEFNVSDDNWTYSSSDGVLFKQKTTLVNYPIGKGGMTYTIPNTVTGISAGAFLGCTSFIYMTIPSNVATIGNDAFLGCTGLKYLVIEDDEKSIGNGAFSGCTALIGIEFGDGVTSIGNGAFYECTALKSVVTGSGVTSIGDNAFLGCGSLETVTINSGTIGSQAFKNCTALKSVTMRDGVTSIGDMAFLMCNKLETAVIPNTVVSIGENAFRGCSSLNSLTIYDQTTSIGDGAFALGVLSESTVPCNVYGRTNDTLGSYCDTKTEFTYYYIVTFRSYDGSTVLDTDTVLHDTDATYPGTTPTRDPSAEYTYTFDGWNSSPNMETANPDILKSISVADKTVYAAFSKTTRQYTVTYSGEGLNVKNGDTPISSPSILDYGTVLTVSMDPRTGYTGKITANGSEISGSSYTVTGDVSLVGSYAGKEYVITLKANYDGGTDGSVTATYGEKLPAFTAVTRTGYHLDGYADIVSGDTIISYLGTLLPSTSYSDGNGKWTYDGTATFYAQWTPLQYTVTIDKTEITVKNGDTPISSGTSVNYDTILTVTMEPKTGYDCNITANGTKVWGSSYTVTGDVTFSGSYEPKYLSIILKANYDGGTDGGVTATYDQALPSFTALERSGYTLNGYYTEASGGVLIISKEGVLQPNTDYSDDNGKWCHDDDATFYAQWNVIEYTITYNVNGGTEIASEKYTIEASKTLSTSTTKNGYTFGGWYDNFILSGTPVTEIPAGSFGDKEFYAKWDPIEYTITYNVNGGSAIASEKYTIEASKTLSTSTTKNGYTFVGWYDNPGLTGPAVTEIPLGSTGDKGFYAKWNVIEYTITYNVNGGSAIPSEKYTVESEKITLPSSSKDGYIFGGWYDNAEFNGDPISEIQKGSTGDRVLYAKWNTEEQNNTVAIIVGVVVAVAAILGVGAFFILRK